MSARILSIGFHHSAAHIVRPRNRVPAVFWADVMYIGSSNLRLGKRCLTLHRRAQLGHALAGRCREKPLIES